MTTWGAWKVANADKIRHPLGFEEKFVDLILSRISVIEPSDVIPQYAFVDEKGRPRRVDFMIINADRGYKLPVELDGYNKADENASSSHWNDFLERQNALVRSFGIVLRFSNAQMFNNGNTIIDDISKTLVLQSAKSYADNYMMATIEALAANVGHGLDTIDQMSRAQARQGARQVQPSPRAPSTHRARRAPVSTPRPPAAPVRNRLHTTAGLCLALVLASYAAYALMGSMGHP